jgi:tetratricopeptide (TPR) repeat protein
MFVFGGLSDQKGTFKNPTSLVNFNGKILVLDAEKNNITVFGLTAFGEEVQKANTLYQNGFYMDALDPWKEVLKHDSNYLLAYVGLGKAYYQMQDYKQAMYYFKLGYDKTGYSDSFKAYSTEYMRQNFDVVLLVLVLMIVIWLLIRKRRKIIEFVRGIRKGGISE